MNPTVDIRLIAKNKTITDLQSYQGDIYQFINAHLHDVKTPKDMRGERGNYHLYIGERLEITSFDRTSEYEIKDIGIEFYLELEPPQIMIKVHLEEVN